MFSEFVTMFDLLLSMSIRLVYLEVDTTLLSCN